MVGVTVVETVKGCVESDVVTEVSCSVHVSGSPVEAMV